MLSFWKKNTLLLNNDIKSLRLRLNVIGWKISKRSRFRLFRRTIVQWYDGRKLDGLGFSKLEFWRAQQ